MIDPDGEFDAILLGFFLLAWCIGEFLFLIGRLPFMAWRGVCFLGRRMVRVIR